jgi:hypothetical protein
MMNFLKVAAESNRVSSSSFCGVMELISITDLVNSIDKERSASVCEAFETEEIVIPATNATFLSSI